MPAFGQQTPEPLARRARFNADPRCLALLPKVPVKRDRLVGMRQLLLLHFSRSVVKDRENFEPGMKITAYNQHRWLLSE